MTAQLAFDLTLPAGPGTVVQRAVVFTALGGPHKGQQVYTTEDEHTPEGWLDWYATKYLPPECDARVMSRTVTCSEWEDV